MLSVEEVKQNLITSDIKLVSYSSTIVTDVSNYLCAFIFLLLKMTLRSVETPTTVSIDTSLKTQKFLIFPSSSLIIFNFKNSLHVLFSE